LAVALAEIPQLSPQSPAKLKAELDEHPEKILKQLQFAADHLTTYNAKRVQADPVPGPCDSVLQPLGERFLNDPNCKLFSSFGSPLENATSITQLHDNINRVCTNPCYQFMVGAFRQIGECYERNGLSLGSSGSSLNFSVISDMFDFFCLQNPASGEYCMALMLDPALRNITGGGKADNATACFAFSQFGCCITRMLKFVAFTGGDLGPIQNTIRTTCGFGLPPDCPRAGATVKIIKAVWRIKGVAYAYYLSHKEAVGNALRKDIAARLNCDQGFIAFSSFREGSLIADFNIRGATDAQTDSIGATAVTASADAATAFPNVIATVGTAGTDAGATIGLDTTASTSTVTTYTAPGAGSHVQPMFALVAALLAVAFFVRQ
jgi:hypothetical protein